MTQFFTTAELSEGVDTLKSYLRREYRENQVSQGFDDPFPDDLPFHEGEPDRLRWMAAIEAKEHDEHKVVNLDDYRNIPRLEMKHGRQQIHIVDIKGVMKVGKKFIKLGFNPFTDNVDMSKMWTAVRQAILDWNDIIEYRLSPRGRAVILIMEPPFTTEEDKHVTQTCQGGIKLRVVVTGTIIGPVSAAQPSGWEDGSVYTQRTIEALNQPDEYGIDEPDLSPVQAYA